MIFKANIYITKRKYFMNKLKTLALAVCFSLVASVASAEMRIGVSAHAMMFETTGSETLRQSNNVTNKNVDEEVVVPSIFVEAMGEDGLGIGLDYVPVAELGSGTGDNDDEETTGANQASAELTSHATVYLIAQHENGIFLRAGVSFADVDTTETLNTGDSYGNASTEGVMAAIGYSRDLDNGMFVRGEVSMTDYDDISLTSTGGSVVAADVDSTAVSLSIGKSF